MLFGDFAESQSKDFQEPIDEGETAEDYGYLSDSDFEDDADETPSSEHTSKPETHPLAAPGENIGCKNHEERVEKGKVVKIPDVAFVTWAATNDPRGTPLMLFQVPSFSDVSLHGSDSVRTIWVRRKSQIAKR